jgi:hypothetical protein
LRDLCFGRVCANGSIETVEGGNTMESKIDQQTQTLEIEIEELESKIAPDGGETVLPLASIHGRR